MMFGQNDKEDNAQIPDQAIDNVLSDITPPTAAAADPGTDTTGAGSHEEWQHPGQPLDDSGAPIPVPEPAFVATPPAPAPAAQPAADGTAGTPHDLIDIKQQALSQLAPLVDQLDQTPEEKFRTTMMMIQASDDQNLVQVAFEAAGKIEDEKTRAQALLDIVNEINYFTSQHDA